MHTTLFNIKTIYAKPFHMMPGGGSNTGYCSLCSKRMHPRNFHNHVSTLDCNLRRAKQEMLLNDLFEVSVKKKDLIETYSIYYQERYLEKWCDKKNNLIPTSTLLPVVYVAGWFGCLCRTLQYNTLEWLLAHLEMNRMYAGYLEGLILLQEDRDYSILVPIVQKAFKSRLSKRTNEQTNPAVETL